MCADVSWLCGLGAASALTPPRVPPRGARRAACRACSLRNLLGVMFSRHFSTASVKRQGAEDGVRPRGCASDWSADLPLISDWSSRPSSAVMSQVDPSRCAPSLLSGLRAAGLSICPLNAGDAGRRPATVPSCPDPTWRPFEGAKDPCFVVLSAFRQSGRAGLLFPDDVARRPAAAPRQPQPANGTSWRSLGRSSSS